MITNFELKYRIPENIYKLNGEIDFESIPTTILGNGVQLLIELVENKVLLTIGGIEVGEKGKIIHEGNNSKQEKELQIMKLQIGTKDFILFLHSTFSNLPSFILHILTIDVNINHENQKLSSIEYNGGFIVLNKCDFENGPLLIGEKTALGITGRNYSQKSSATEISKS